MKRIRSYISIIMLALLLFPIVEKAKHNLEHIKDTHCGIKDKHYCKAEHRCHVCAYVFSASANPPKTQEQLVLFSKETDTFKTLLVFNTTVAPKFRLSLRGPPFQA